MMNETKSMPMVALRGMTVIPEMLIHFDVSRSRSIEAVQRVMRSKEQQIFLVAQKELGIEEPGQADVYEIGTIATVKQIAKMSKNVIRVLVVGEKRARLLNIEENDPCLVAEIEELEEQGGDEEVVPDHLEAKTLQQLFFEYTLKNGKIPREVVTQVADAKTFRSLIYQVAANVPMDYVALQEILEIDDVKKR